MEVLYHIRPYFVGIFPYIGLIYGRYLQFRFLKWSLIICEGVERLFHWKSARKVLPQHSVDAHCTQHRYIMIRQSLVHTKGLYDTQNNQKVHDGAPQTLCLFIYNPI